MSVRWEGVDPQLHEAFTALTQIVADAGGVLTLTSTIRSTAEQKFLWDRYQSGLSGGLPAAPPGHSAHEYGWAIDMVVDPRSWLPDVGKVWTSWGGVYGGSRDPVHFELSGAGALAWQMGEAGQVAETQPRNQSTSGIGLLPQRWKNYIYQAEDIALGFVPVEGTVQLISFLLSLGFPDSEILKILESPVSELHKRYPWIPF